MKRILILFLFSFLKAQAQLPNVDSLKQLAASHPVDTVRINAFAKLGRFYWERNPDSAIYFAGLQLQLSRSIKNQLGEATALSRIGRAYNIKGDYAKSMTYLIQSVPLFEALKDSVGLANNYNHIGNVNKGNEKYDLALYYYRKCLQIARSINDVEDQMIGSMNIGSIYLEQKQTDSALFYAQQAFLLQRKLKNTGELDVILYLLGSVYDAMGEKEMAKAYFYRSLDVSLNDRDSRPASMAYTALARMQLETGQKDSALRNAKLGLQHAQLTSYLKGIFNASLLISQLLEDRGQLDSAFVYQKMAYNAKDSLFGVEKTRQVAAMNYSEQQREQEIISRKNQDLEERKMNLQYAAIGIALVLGLLVFLLLSRQVITSTRTIEIVGVVALLFIFEFINLLIHPFIGRLTHHSPLWMLLIMVGIAALLVPLHHRVEKRMTHQLVEKNKRIRLAAAKKTIAQLDKQEHAPGDGEAVKHGGK